MYTCKNLDEIVLLQSVFHVGLSVFALSAKYNFIVSRSTSECNTTIYYSGIDWTIVLGQTETICEDGTIIRTVGKARPGSSYQIPTPVDRSPNNCVRR